MLDYIATQDLFWRHPKDYQPPKAKKLLLYLNTGITVIGDWRDIDCLLWMPMPKVTKEMKQRLESEQG